MLRGCRGRALPAALAGSPSIQHASFVRRNLSLHSSANNHLLGEAAGPVHRRDHLALLAARRRHGPREARVHPRARSAAAERSRRRQPRAGGRTTSSSCSICSLLPSARGQGQRPEVLRRVRIADRGDARVSRLDHGRRRQRSHVRRRRRRARRRPRPGAVRTVRYPVAARHRRDPVQARRFQGEGRRAGRQDALASRRRARNAAFEACRRAQAGCRSAVCFPRAATTSSAAISRRKTRSG